MPQNEAEARANLEAIKFLHNAQLPTCVLETDSMVIRCVLYGV